MHFSLCFEWFDAVLRKLVPLATEFQSIDWFDYYWFCLSLTYIGRYRFVTKEISCWITLFFVALIHEQSLLFRVRDLRLLDLAEKEALQILKFMQQKCNTAAYFLILYDRTEVVVDIFVDLCKYDTKTCWYNATMLTTVSNSENHELAEPALLFY